MSLSTLSGSRAKRSALRAPLPKASPEALDPSPIVEATRPVKAIGEASTASGEALENGARSADRFAREPLKVDNDVIVAPQPAPKVPFQAQAPRR